MATLKSCMKSAAHAQTLPSNAANASVNRAGGVAFEISDPSLKLVTMTGGSFFAEPTFYAGTLAAKRVSAVKGASTREKFDRMEQRLLAVDNKTTWIDTSDVDSVTKEILATATAIAEGPNPEDLLIIAKWLRKDMNIRATPQALLVVASRLDATKPFVRKYAPHIVVRPDEVKTCLLMHRFFFGMKSLKNCLGQGLSDAMSKFGERALLKYDSAGWPTWKDVLQVLPRGGGRPLAAPMAKYFLKGEVVDASATPIIAARKELAQLDTFGVKAKTLAKASMVNWEVLLSQFSDKKAVWEFLLDENLVGYMALLRNLRNMLQAGISPDTVKKVSLYLADRDEVVRSKQLPFRFLSAYKSLMDADGVKDTADLAELLAAVELASNVAAESISLPGTTAIFADASGSMTSQTVSDKSSRTCAEVASVMAGIAAKASDRAYLFEFATDVKGIRFSKTDTVLGIANRFKHEGVGGHNTNAWKIAEFLREKGITPDRVIVLSDMQAWNDSSMSGLGGYHARSASERKAMCDTWGDYVASSKAARDTWLHCIHLNGHGDSPVDSGARVNQLSGFSEKVFGMLLDTEGGRTVDGPQTSIPTVEQIRINHSL